MRTLNISADGSYAFENIYTHKPSVIVAQIVTDGTFNGSIAFKKKALYGISGLVDALYIDDILKQVANAAIAGAGINKIVIIDSAGAQVSAEVTGVTLGNLQIEYVVLEDSFPAFKVASGGGTPTADVTVVTALPPGNNNIGDVDIASIAAGDNNIGNVDVLTLPDVNLSVATLAALETITAIISGDVNLSAATLAALETISIGTALPVGNNNIGDVDVVSIVPVDLSVATLAALENISIVGALPAGGNNIGDVDVLTLPAVDLSPATLAALETIQIGSLPAVALDAPTLAALESIGIHTLPSLPAGVNNIGDVDVLTLPAISLAAGANNIGDVDIASSVDLNLSAATLAALETITIGTALPAGANNIGDVDVLTLPSIPAGGNNIGDVDVLTLPALVAGTAEIGRVETKPTILHVTATAVVNTASTCTLPAAGAGLFHYITRIELVKLYAVVGTAAAAGVLVSTTNLPGNPVFTTEQAAGTLGTAPKVILMDFHGNPLKSSVANTATTFVAPLQAQTIWRWNISYYTGP